MVLIAKPRWAFMMTVYVYQIALGISSKDVFHCFTKSVTSRKLGLE